MYTLSIEYQKSKKKMFMKMYQKKKNDINKMKNELSLLKENEIYSRKQLTKYIEIYEKKSKDILEKLKSLHL